MDEAGGHVPPIHNRVYLEEVSYGRRSSSNGEPRYLKIGAHEPLVRPEVWERAQRPASPAVQKPRAERAEYLLTGVLRCAACGYSAGATRGRNGQRRYRCTKRHSGGERTSTWGVSADVIEPVVVDLFWSTLSDLVATGHRRADHPVDDTLREQLARAEARYEQAKLPEFQDAFLDGWGDIVASRRADRDEARAALARVEEEQAQRLTDVQVVSLRERWPGLSIPKRRALLPPGSTPSPSGAGTANWSSAPGRLALPLTACHAAASDEHRPAAL